MPRLNFTGRRKIRREDARIKIAANPDGSCRFVTDLKLARYGLPGDAEVFVEAYRQTAWMRWPYGVVAAVKPPPDTRLTDFADPAGVLFRVKVSAKSDGQGKLLATGDRLRPLLPDEVDEKKASLLPVRSDDIEQLVWRLDFDPPTLVINKSAGAKENVVRSPQFQALVLPAVLHQLFTCKGRLKSAAGGGRKVQHPLPV